MVIGQKIISDREINFEQNKYNKFQEISASFAKNKCKNWDHLQFNYSMFVRQTSHTQ